MHFTEWPIEFGRFVLQRIGEDAYWELVRASKQTGKVDWVVELERLRSIEKAA
jgi:hypothetical protein